MTDGSDVPERIIEASYIDPLDLQTFFSVGYIKGLVYVPPLPTSVDDLKTRITETLTTIGRDMLV